MSQRQAIGRNPKRRGRHLLGATRTGTVELLRFAPVEMDGELLSRVRTGDEEAFVMLVARYQQPMLRLACSMVTSQQVAEEAVQDTWLGVVRGIERFEGRSSFKTWLFRILVNRVRSAGSREPTDPSIETIQAVDPTRFDAQGQWADPVDHWTEASEDRLDAAAWVPILKSALDQTACTSAPGRHVARRRRPFQRRSVRRAWTSASATSGSCSTGDARACERSSTPRSRRADRAVAATKRHRVSAGGRTRHRLSRRGSFPSGSTAIRGSSEAVPELCRVPGADQDNHSIGRRDRA